MTSLQEIYSPQQLLMLSKTFGKLTRLVTPSNTTPPKVSKLISVMEVLRLHFTVTKHINGYLRVIPSHTLSRPINEKMTNLVGSLSHISLPSK